MPKPRVEKWDKSKDRNKSGKWRKKRKDEGKRRKYSRDSGETPT